MPPETRLPEGGGETPVRKEMRIQDMQDLANHLIQEAPRVIQEAEQFLDASFNNFDPQSKPAQHVIQSLEGYLHKMQEILLHCTSALDLLKDFTKDEFRDRTNVQAARQQLKTTHQKLQEAPHYKRLKALLYLLKSNPQPGEWLFIHQPKSKNDILYRIQSIEGTMLRAYKTNVISGPHDKPTSHPHNNIVTISLAELRENHELLYAVKTVTDIEADIAARAARRPH